MAAVTVALLGVLGLNICHADDVDNVFQKKNYVYWPNATVPFYITPTHFDREQSLSIMTSLSMFAFKTCIKFLPVMAEPQGAEHVLVLENPGALRQCRWSTTGHSIEEAHRVNLGYQCLKSPHIEMAIMRALGFPFEHNRASRDLFIDVQYENIEPGNLVLFAKDPKLPLELRNLPYDVNSAMHFGERDFSKNGHRTIIIKVINSPMDRLMDRKTKQNRVGLSDIDLRKIEVVYGPECQKRDRQEKIDMCQIYPGVARKKREADVEEEKNLRVNREIKPPANKNLTDDVVNTLRGLGIVKEVEGVVDTVYKTVAIAVENAKKKYCNVSKVALRNSNSLPANLTSVAPNILNIIEAIAKFSQSFVDMSIANLTVFCGTTDAIETYQRIVCHPNIHDSRCPSYYKSTKSGPVVHYTQHRPVYYQSTKHTGKGIHYQYGRSGNDTEVNINATAVVAKRKREAHKESVEDKLVQVKLISKSTNALPVVKDNLEGNKTTRYINKKVSKQSLRSATSVSIKKEHYAPFRRSERRFRCTEKINTENLSETHGRLKPKKKAERNSDITEDSDDDEQKQEERAIRQHSKKKQVGTAAGSGIREIPQTVPLLKKNKEFYADRKWPGGVVRYVITDYEEYNLHDLRARIQQVKDILINKTCVQLEELSETDAKRHNDYLVLDTSPDYVTGRVGGRQGKATLLLSNISYILSPYSYGNGNYAGGIVLGSFLKLRRPRAYSTLLQCGLIEGLVANSGVEVLDFSSHPSQYLDARQYFTS